MWLRIVGWDRLSARAAWGAVALSGLLACGRAHAQDSQLVRATILQIDGDDVVIDAGRARIAEAQTLTVYRAIEVRHPITRKTLRDRFAIGALTVVQTGDTLSVAKPNGVPSHPFAIGDVVEMPGRVGARDKAGSAPPSGTSPTESATASAAPSPTTTATASNKGNVAKGGAAQAAPSSDENELGAAWYATLAKPPEQRAEIYAALLGRHPDSRYRKFLLTEIAYLRSLSTKLGATEAERETDAHSTPAFHVTLLPLHAAREDEAVDLAGLVRPDPALRGLIVQARPLETDEYATYPVAIDARGHARVTLPPAVARSPGFAYFIESVDKDGQARPAVGTAQSPQIVIVKSRTHAPPPTEPSTRVRFSSELVSFDGTSGRDYFLLTEGDFLYRVRFGHLYGVRVGYGEYRGQGGTVDELDKQGLAPRPAGFTYGFIETELELHRLFGLAARGTVGLGRPEDPSSERNGLTGGFQLRARIGAADGTHLVLAGEVMPEIGQRAYLGLRWEAIRNVPMATEVVVTDQPVHSDELAVRLIYEIGYRVTERIALALRPSYELRTIAHAGPGVGIAATFDW